MGIVLQPREGGNGKNRYTIEEDKVIEVAWNEGKSHKGIQQALEEAGFKRSYNSVMWRVAHLQGKR